MEDDFIEMGDTNLVPRSNGWFFNTLTQEYVDPEGNLGSEADYQASFSD